MTEDGEDSRGNRSRSCLGAALLSLGVSVLVCIVGGWVWLRHTKLEYARAATGLQLSEIGFVVICDESDIGVGYHLRASEVVIQQIDEQRRAVPEEWEGRRAELLSARFRSCLPALEGGRRLIYSAGCSDYQAWVGLLDPVTEELWLEVRFPDNAGDVPGCPPGTERGGPTNGS